jgi:transposase InsO family protein
MAEVEQMSRTVSTSADRPYGLARVCRVWEVARSTVYAARGGPRPAGATGPRRRGPRGPYTDEELLDRIRQVLADSPWLGEGHRKVWARLRHGGTRTSKRRVLRLMREAGLLAPGRAGRPRGPQVHDRSIIPDEPDVMWGTDATSTLTGEGNATIFTVLDHCTAECLGLHAARHGTRFEALEPLRQGVRERWGKFDEGVAVGLSLRHDHGSQFVSDVYQDELRFLGIASSPAFVATPEGNGCCERFIRTLKEQLLWVWRFETVAELNEALRAFKERYNREWLIERHGFLAPAAYREQLVGEAAA